MFSYELLKLRRVERVICNTSAAMAFDGDALKHEIGAVI